MQIPTNPMYDIDDNGVVRLISNNVVVPEYRNHHGRRSVKIRGKSHKASSWPLDRLMLLAYSPLPLDKNHEWMSIRFKDGNGDNIRIDNLEWDGTWWYPNPSLGIEFGVTGWIQAYDHPDVELRLDHGVVHVRYSLTHQELGSKDLHGYQMIRVPGRSKELRKHRLVALTFRPHPLDTDHLTVNHKDSDKAHNDPNNIEWATYTQNNFHSFSEGPRGDTVRKIRLKHVETGNEIVVAGYNEMGRQLGVLPQAAHQAMERRKFEGRPYKGYVFKFEDDPRSWYELSHSGPRNSMQIPDKIACKDTATGEVRIYTSFSQLLDEEKIRSFMVFRLLNSEIIVPWRRKLFQKVVEGKSLTWPDYPEHILRVFEDVHSSDRPIQVTNLDGNIEYHTSVTSWCREDRTNRCDPAVLVRYMKKNGSKPLQWRDWVFTHIDLNDYLHGQS